jgi:hypothetical protein
MILGITHVILGATEFTLGIYSLFSPMDNINFVGVISADIFGEFAAIVIEATYFSATSILRGKYELWGIHSRRTIPINRLWSHIFTNCLRRWIRSSISLLRRGVGMDVGVADEWDGRPRLTKTGDMALPRLTALSILNPRSSKATQYTWQREDLMREISL